jgi:hypothetical protein
MIADTSRTALQEVQRDIDKRQRFVLDGLIAYLQTRGDAPTAYELLCALRVSSDNPTLDVNAVRPRLTELEALGRVAKGDKRRCAVTGKTAYAWTIGPRAHLPAAVLARVPSTGVLQGSLL